MNRDQLLELLDDYLEGELTESRQVELEAQLLQHPAARQLYWEYMQQHLLIQKIEQESDGRVLASTEIAPAGAACAPAPAGKRPRWPWLIGLAAGLLCAVGVAQYFRPGPAPVPPGAELMLASASQATIVRDGAEQAGQPGMALHWGDRVVVAEDGAAVVRHQNAFKLDIGGDSAVALAEADGRKVLDVSQGKVAVERSGAAPALQINTPTAESQLPAGAGKCLVVAAPTSTRLEVESGTAQLRRKSDQLATEVSPGTYAVAAPGLPMAARPIPKHESGDNSPVLLATWLGGTGASTLSAVAVAADGSIYAAGTLPGADVSLWRPDRVNGKGDGLILRLAADGSRLLAVMRLEGTVDALRLDEAGHVLAAGSFGCAKLDASLRQTLWTAPLKSKNSRIVAGPDGGAVVLTGAAITVLDGQGKKHTAWTIADRDVRDIACDVVGRQVFVAGCSFADKVGRVVPFVRAYDTAGNRLWNAYDWTPEQIIAKGLGAGSEGVCLALGRDGQLYVAGQAHGGNTVWGRGSQDIDQKLPSPRGDRFQAAYNIGNQHLTFIGRLDARTGRAEAGTVLLGRHTADKGASMRPSALAVDVEGRVYVGGWAGATPPTSKGAFGLHGQGGGAFLCVFDRDFNRLYAARLCGGKTTALAVGASAIIAAGDARDGLTTVRPVQPEPLGDDGWLVVFRKTPGIEYESPILPLR